MSGSPVLKQISLPPLDLYVFNTVLFFWLSRFVAFQGLLNLAIYSTEPISPFLLIWTLIVELEYPQISPSLLKMSPVARHMTKFSRSSMVVAITNLGRLLCFCGLPHAIS